MIGRHKRFAADEERRRIQIEGKPERPRSSSACGTSGVSKKP